MNEKIRFIPCDEKTLIKANHTTGIMKSSKYAYTKGKGRAIAKSGKIRTEEEIKKLKNR